MSSTRQEGSTVGGGGSGCTEEQLQRLSKPELIELSLLLFEAKTRATSQRKSAEAEIQRYREGKESMRLKAIELLKRCKAAQFEKAALEEHLASAKDECERMSRQLRDTRNDYTSFQRELMDDGVRTVNRPGSGSGSGSGCDGGSGGGGSGSGGDGLRAGSDDNVVSGMQDDLRRYRMERDKYRSIVDKTLPKIMLMRDELDAKNAEVVALKAEALDRVRGEISGNSVGLGGCISLPAPATPPTLASGHLSPPAGIGSPGVGGGGVRVGGLDSSLAMLDPDVSMLSIASDHGLSPDPPALSLMALAPDSPDTLGLNKALSDATNTLASSPYRDFNGTLTITSPDIVAAEAEAAAGNGSGGSCGRGERPLLRAPERAPNLELMTSLRAATAALKDKDNDVMVLRAEVTSRIYPHCSSAQANFRVLHPSHLSIALF
jgi:hypothetical protein